MNIKFVWASGQFSGDAFTELFYGVNKTEPMSAFKVFIIQQAHNLKITLP